MIRKLGRGKYSDVYEGIDPNTGKRVVVKILKPVRNSKILREIKILDAVKGGPNIINMLEKCYNPQDHTTCLVNFPILLSPKLISKLDIRVRFRRELQRGESAFERSRDQIFLVPASQGSRLLSQ